MDVLLSCYICKNDYNINYNYNGPELNIQMPCMYIASVYHGMYIRVQLKGPVQKPANSTFPRFLVFFNFIYL